MPASCIGLDFTELDCPDTHSWLNLESSGSKTGSSKLPLCFLTHTSQITCDGNWKQNKVTPSLVKKAWRLTECPQCCVQGTTVQCATSSTCLSSATSTRPKLWPRWSVLQPSSTQTTKPSYVCALRRAAVLSSIKRQVQAARMNRYGHGQGDSSMK